MYILKAYIQKKLFNNTKIAGRLDGGQQNSFLVVGTFFVRLFCLFNIDHLAKVCGMSLKRCKSGDVTSLMCERRLILKCTRVSAPKISQNFKTQIQKENQGDHERKLGNHQK